MPSVALQTWSASRMRALDEIENAHRSVGGSGPGRRYATQQINQAYAMLLSSQFQGFCRDLHTECVDCLVFGTAPRGWRSTLKWEFLWNRRLDRGNPNPANIGMDFRRLGVEFWTEVEGIDTRNPARRSMLEELNVWRNAIAHQDFDPAILGGTTTLGLAKVRAWRSACSALAGSFDDVMRQFIQRITGTTPW